MAPTSYETTAAFRELLDLVRDSDALFLEGGRAPGDETAVVEGYRWLTQILAVALDCYLWGDAARPTLVPIVGPTKKWGGDNADAYYRYAAIDPDRRYRVRGRRGDAAYLSLTLYGGPDDGRWSTRIVDTLNDRRMELAPDGSFEVTLGPEPRSGNHMQLAPDSVALVTRDYLVDPVSGRQARWEIEAEEPAPPPRPSDAEVAARLRRAANFLRDLTGVFPLAYDESKLNAVEEPYPQPPVTYGWAAGDAAYAMGSFDLGPEEALLLEGRSPECAFWNVCLWNAYLQTYDYRYERVTLNGGQVRYEPDGSWRIVVAHGDPGLPNWISTAGHRRGRIWFRWFLAETTPERPRARLLKLSELSA